MTDLCQRCGLAPRAITHVCPPLDSGSTLAPALSVFTGPDCPSCWRRDGSHELLCPVAAYIAAWMRP